MNILMLAYLGDSVYEVYIRKYLIDKNIVKVNTLQKEAIKLTSAKGQALYVTKMIEKEFLTKEELDLYYRGRNAKSKSSPKNTDIITYKIATGFETIIGELYLNNDIKRIEEIIAFICDSFEESNKSY